MSVLISWFAAVMSYLSWLFGIRTLRASEIGRGRTVVIVGGGFAGATLAHYLDTTTAFDIILYEKKDYFEFTPSIPRVIVDPPHMASSHIPYSQVSLLQSPRIRMVHEEVVAITDAAVQGRGGEWTKYDKLVLAMGSDYYGTKRRNGQKPCDWSASRNVRLSVR
jgi:thioredoxin reductase